MCMRTAMMVMSIFLVLGHILFADNQANTGSPETDLARERNQTFAWFSSLSYPDVKDAPFVHVATGQPAYGAGDPPKNFHDFGFLLKEGKSFTVLTLGLEVKTFRGSPPGTPALSRIGYEKMDLGKLADAYLKSWPDAAQGGEIDGLENKLWYVYQNKFADDTQRRRNDIWHDRNRGRTWEPIELFVAAWACQRQGSTVLAKRLYERARSIPRDPHRTSAKMLAEFIALELSWAELWRTAQAFEDVELSWVQLRERCERVIRICPDSTCVPEVRERVKILNRMIREEEEHARQRQNAPSFEKLSKTEQIAELVFQLRNQTGQGVFTSRTGKEMHDSPAHRLARMGYEVIPSLVEVLGDKGITRSVGFMGAISGPTIIDDYFCRHMLTVGECAKYIIERIAGRSFPYPGEYGDTASLKRAVRDWYAELQRKGEKRMLIEAVERGDDNSTSQGALLLERYPRDAFPALVKGARVPRDYPPIRGELVSLIARVNGDEPLRFLLEEVKKGPYVVSRVAAARGLHARKRREGVDAMIAEWNAGLPVIDSSDNLWADKNIFALTEIARFLASSGSADAIDVLGKQLRERLVGLRVEVIAAFLDSESKATWGDGDGGINKAASETRKQTVAIREAVERLLVSALDDQDQHNSSGIWMGKDILCPRICDYAGHVLNEIDPATYGFDLAAPLADRNRRRVELKNAWRRVRQQPPLPVPPPRIVPPVPEEKLERLLMKLPRNSSQEQKEVREAIESLGLGALPGVLRRLEKETDAGHETLEQIGRRLACIVDRIEFAEQSLKPDAALGARLQSLKRRSLNPAIVIQIVADTAKSPPKGVYGIVFSAYRGADGKGVMVYVDLLNRARAVLLRPALENSSKSWDFDEYVKIGRKGIHGVSGATNTLVWDERDLSGTLAEACAAPPLMPFEMSVQLVGQWR
jgi:hypothetical protein